MTYPTFFLATPAHDGRVEGCYASALLDAAGLILATGNKYLRMDGESDIHRARSQIATMFLEQSECAVLVFIDSDIDWRAQQLARLLLDTAAAPIVAGVYQKKRPGPPQLVYHEPRGESIPGEPELLEVAAAGTGFMAIRREVLEKLTGSAPEVFATNHPWRLYFRGAVFGGRYLTEDYNFCRLAAAHGFKTYIDRRIRLGHRGAATYSTAE